MTSDSPTPIDTTPPPPPLPQPPSPPPLCLPAPPIYTPATASVRRLPPPCWSNDETVALIEAYRDKWYSLRRGNLKATHWQEVADEVGRRCPNVLPSKTCVQCRHKMEKLRKRYRTEIQRARSLPVPVSRYVSNWVHFRLMDDMEKGPVAMKVEGSDSGDGYGEGEGEDEEDDDDGQRELYGNGVGVNMRSIHKLYGNGVGVGGSGGSSSGGGSGFRIRIPTGVSVAQPGMRYYGRVQPPPKFNMGASPSPGFCPSQSFGPRVVRDGNVARSVLGKSDRERGMEKDPWEEMVGAIQAFGDGFVRMEKMKMEMARDIESLRMEMEMKRTRMILESQQQIVDAFADAVAEKRAKKMERFHPPDA